MDSGPSTSTNQDVSAKKRRPRLANEGIELLKDHFDNVTMYPTEEDKQMLLAKIQQLPGHANYDMAKLVSFFRRHRGKKFRSKGDSNNTSQSNSLWPSLTEDMIIHLRVLCENRTVASSDFMATCANVLHADVHDVTMWFNTEFIGEPNRRPPRDHLPTPSQSPTSAALRATSSPSPISPMFSSAVLRETPAEFKVEPDPEEDDWRMTILRSAQIAVATSRKPSHSPPTTAEGFKEAFSSYEGHIRAIIQKCLS